MTDAEKILKAELRPCPFCGRKPKLKDLGMVKFISCDFSGCGVQPYIVYPYKPEKEKEAIETWNKRLCKTQYHVL